MSDSVVYLRRLSPDEEKMLDNKFEFHPSENKERQRLHEIVRESCHDLALIFVRVGLPDYEGQQAIAAIEQAMMWANAGVARVTAEGARR